jgi:hypothetical protein
MAASGDSLSDILVSHALFEFCYELPQCHPHTFADSLQLYDVDAAFTAFDFADSRLFEREAVS